MLDCWEAIDEVAQVLTVATSYDELLLSDKDRFFGSAMAVLDATIKAIAAAIMQSSFFISPRPLCTAP
jgi:hypothetical protein